MIKKYQNLTLSLIFLLVLTISAVIRVGQSAHYQFPFTYDQSRDLLSVRILGTFKDILFVGPTTSINGVMLGPGYYYLNLPAFWIWGGDPQGLIYWNILWFLGASVAIFLFFYKKNSFLGFFLSVIYLMSPQLFDTTRYFWNAHAMVYVTVFYFLLWWSFLDKPGYLNSLLLGVSVGIAMHFEAAFAIVLLIFAIILVMWTKKLSLIKWFLIGSLPWFLPQIAFEISKKMIMTKLLIAEFTQGSGILGSKLTIVETINLHWSTILSYFEGQFIIPYGWGLVVLLLFLVGGLISSRYQRFTLGLIFFILFTFLFYVLVYHHELKKWYLYGLRIWYVFAVGIGIMAWLDIFKNKRPLLIGYTLLISCFLIRSFYLTIFDQKQFINNPNFAKDDPKLMDHQLQTISWVYKQTEAQGFKAYNFVPEIYDFSYQYLYWWYGYKNFGFTPETISYLPDVPPYVPRQFQFSDHAKKSDGHIALIYERKGDYQQWLKQFNQYCLKNRIDFDWQVSAEIRTLCSKTN